MSRNTTTKFLSKMNDNPQVDRTTSISSEVTLNNEKVLMMRTKSASSASSSCDGTVDDSATNASPSSVMESVMDEGKRLERKSRRRLSRKEKQNKLHHEIEKKATENQSDNINGKIDTIDGATSSSSPSEESTKPNSHRRWRSSSRSKEARSVSCPDLPPSNDESSRNKSERPLDASTHKFFTVNKPSSCRGFDLKDDASHKLVKQKRRPSSCRNLSPSSKSGDKSFVTRMVVNENKARASAAIKKQTNKAEGTSSALGNHFQKSSDENCETDGKNCAKSESGGMDSFSVGSFPDITFHGPAGDDRIYDVKHKSSSQEVGTLDDGDKAVKKPSSSRSLSSSKDTRRDRNKGEKKLRSSSHSSKGERGQKQQKQQQQQKRSSSRSRQESNGKQSPTETKKDEGERRRALPPRSSSSSSKAKSRKPSSSRQIRSSLSGSDPKLTSGKSRRSPSPADRDRRRSNSSNRSKKMSSTSSDHSAKSMKGSSGHGRSSSKDRRRHSSSRSLSSRSDDSFGGSKSPCSSTPTTENSSADGALTNTAGSSDDMQPSSEVANIERPQSSSSTDNGPTYQTPGANRPSVEGFLSPEMQSSRQMNMGTPNGGNPSNETWSACPKMTPGPVYSRSTRRRRNSMGGGHGSASQLGVSPRHFNNSGRISSFMQNDELATGDIGHDADDRSVFSSVSYLGSGGAAFRRFRRGGHRRRNSIDAMQLDGRMVTGSGDHFNQPLNAFSPIMAPSGKFSRRNSTGGAPVHMFTPGARQRSGGMMTRRGSCNGSVISDLDMGSVVSSNSNVNYSHNSPQGGMLGGYLEGTGQRRSVMVDLCDGSTIAGTPQDINNVTPARPSIVVDFDDNVASGPSLSIKVVGLNSRNDVMRRNSNSFSGPDIQASIDEHQVAVHPMRRHSLAFT